MLFTQDEQKSGFIISSLNPFKPTSLCTHFSVSILFNWRNFRGWLMKINDFSLFIRQRGICENWDELRIEKQRTNTKTLRWIQSSTLWTLINRAMDKSYYLITSILYNYIFLYYDVVEYNTTRFRALMDWINRQDSRQQSLQVWWSLDTRLQPWRVFPAAFLICAESHANTHISGL